VACKEGSMDFELTIKNLGNIEQAIFNIKPFTIIAGENSSGKSFATKGLYCLLDALNRDYLSQEVGRSIAKIEEFVDSLERISNKPSNTDMEFFSFIKFDVIDFLKSILIECDEAYLTEQDFIYKKYEPEIEKIVDRVMSYRDKKESVKKFEKAFPFLDSLAYEIRSVRNALLDINRTVVNGLNSVISENLKKNFQHTEFSSFVNHNTDSTSAEITMSNIGNLKFGQKDNLGFSFKSKGIEEAQKLNNVVFIDSPVYLKLRKPLQRSEKMFTGLFSRVRESERYLSGLPNYIEKIYQNFDLEFIEKPRFSDLSDKIIGIIQGKLNVTQSGEIYYETTEGKKVPLSLTAMGISNLGLIERLIRNNTIAEGSFLIIDEPEVHLHPKWQVALVDVLYELAKNGVNVVIATHSIDMVKAVEVLLNKDESAEKLISVNKMPYSSKFLDLTEKEKVKIVLNDLASPFYKMYMNGFL
jgi:predicted ATPase